MTQSPAGAAAARGRERQRERRGESGTARRTPRLAGPKSFPKREPAGSGAAPPRSGRSAVPMRKPSRALPGETAKMRAALPPPSHSDGFCMRLEALQPRRLKLSNMTAIALPSGAHPQRAVCAATDRAAESRRSANPPRLVCARRGSGGAAHAARPAAAPSSPSADVTALGRKPGAAEEENGGFPSEERESVLSFCSAVPEGTQRCSHPALKTH